MDVQLLRRKAVLRTVDAVREVAVLVGKEDVVGLFLPCLFDPFFSYALDILDLLDVIRLIFLACILQHVLIIGRGFCALDGGGVAGRDHAAVEILLVFDAVFRHQTTPMCVGVFGIFANDVVEFLLCLAEFRQTQLLERRIQEGHFFIGKLLRLMRAARPTDPAAVSVFILTAAIVTDIRIHACSLYCNDDNTSFYHKNYKEVNQKD